MLGDESTEGRRCSVGWSWWRAFEGKEWRLSRVSVCVSVSDFVNTIKQHTILHTLTADTLSVMSRVLLK